MSWIFVAPDLGTISTTVVRGSEVTNHDQNEPRPDVGTLWNSSKDWGKIRETIKAKLDMLAISKCDLQDQRLFYSLGMLP